MRREDAGRASVARQVGDARWQLPGGSLVTIRPPSAVADHHLAAPGRAARPASRGMLPGRGRRARRGRRSRRPHIEVDRCRCAGCSARPPHVQAHVPQACVQLRVPSRGAIAPAVRPVSTRRDPGCAPRVRCAASVMRSDSAHHLVHAVSDEQDQAALAREPAHQREDRLAVGEIERRGHLVEDQHARLRAPAREPARPVAALRAAAGRPSRRAATAVARKAAPAPARPRSRRCPRGQVAANEAVITEQDIVGDRCGPARSALPGRRSQTLAA